MVQTGMVAGASWCRPPPTRAGILAPATMTLDELAAAKGQGRHRQAIWVNIRADAADAGDRVELMIREVRVARSRWHPNSS